ncbi:MAG: VWA domain-containing protein [Bdellovibrionales bacterium]|nr:VWA domain-containing protein [Bdellovibrionales bacterium]
MNSFPHFEHLWLSAGAGLVFVGAIVVLVGQRVRGVSFARSFSLFLWFVGTALVLLAASQPYLEHETPDSVTLVAIDISESEEPAQIESAIELLRQKIGSSSQTVGFLPFAGKVAPYPTSLSDYTSFSSLQESWQKLNLGETNTEQALEAALSYGPSSVVLVSDGFQTKGEASRIVSEYQQRGVPLHAIIPQRSQGNSSFFIKQLFAPLIAPGQTPIDIRVTVENSSEQPQSGVLEVKQGDKVLYSEKIEVKPGEERVITVKSDSEEKGGIQKLEATLKASDGDFGESSQKAFLSTARRNKILLLSGSQQDERFIRQALEESGFEIEAKILSRAGSLEGVAFDQFTTVILNNVAAPVLSESFSSGVAPFVRGGGALVMIGGERGYGLSGYDKTPIDAVLPVESLPPRQEQRRLNVAVQLVLDKSRSMSFGDKIEYAKEAAREVVRNLKDEDYIGVIGFDSTPFVAFPLRQLGPSRSQALSRIGTLYPIGKTNLFPALDEAMRGLLKAQAGRKHMIVLTDGKIPDQGPHYLTLVQNMRTYGITVSTVMMGREADVQMLRQMAEYGGGAFYQTFDARSLPRIFLSDIRVTTGEQTMKESREYLVRRKERSKTLSSLESFPPIRGYVETKARPKASVELIAYAAGTADPLLASWKFGSGKSVAFTTDVSGRWSNYWIRWEKFRFFWKETIDSLFEQGADDKNDPSRFDLNMAMVNGSLRVELHHLYENLGDVVEASVTRPDGIVVSIPFSKRAEGRFEAEIADPIPGKYVVNGKVGSLNLTPVAKWMGGELFGEQKGKGFNLPEIISWTSQAGGKINPPSEDLFAGGSAQVKKEFGRFLLPFALLFLLLSTIFREVISRRGGASFVSSTQTINYS